MNEILIMLFKNAISSIIAIVLLLIVSILSVIFIQTWLLSSSSDLFDAIDQTNSIRSNLDVLGLENKVLYVSSNPLEDITEIKVMDTSGKEICTLKETNTIQESNYIAWWKFDEISPVITDYSLNGNDANVYGDSLLLLDFDDTQFNDRTGYNFSVINRNSIGTSSNGVSGSSASFDTSSSQYFEVGNSSTFNLTNTSQVSFSLWYNFTGSSRYQAALFSKADSGWQSGPGYILFATEGNLLNLRVFENSSESISLSTPSGSSLKNIWNHVAVVFDQGDVKIYLNGVLEGEDSFQFNGIESSDPFLIGLDGWSSKYFNGTIDEFGVYGKALSELEIQNLYEKRDIDFIEFEEYGLGKAFRFDGDDDSMTFPELTLDLSQNISIVLKFQPERKEPVFNTIFEDSSVNYFKFLFLRFDSNYIGIESNTNNNQCRIVVEKNLEDGRVNILFNVGNYLCSGFSDGFSIANESGPLIDNLTISGINLHDNTNAFKGLLDEVIIYNGTLSPFDVNSISLNSTQMSNSIKEIDLNNCDIELGNTYTLSFKTQSSISSHSIYYDLE